jgi:hypothetical protein
VALHHHLQIVLLEDLGQGGQDALGIRGQVGLALLEDGVVELVHDLDAHLAFLGHDLHWSAHSGSFCGLALDHLLHALLGRRRPSGLGSLAGAAADLGGPDRRDVPRNC